MKSESIGALHVYEGSLRHVNRILSFFEIAYPLSQYIITPSVLSYRSFDFFNIKFDHLSHSKIYVKYHFFIVVFFINTSPSRIT